MSGVLAVPAPERAQIAYLKMASDTLYDELGNIDLVLSYFTRPANDGGAAQWEAVCGELRIYASGANELLARFVANKPYMDRYLFDMTKVLVFDESDVEWAQVAGKGYALLLAGLAEHLANQLGGSGHDRTKAAVDFVERHHRRILRQLENLNSRPRLVGKTLPRNWPQ
jgi:hypothetical protein